MVVRPAPLSPLLAGPALGRLSTQVYHAGGETESGETGALDNIRHGMSIFALRDFYTCHSILFVTSWWGIELWGDENP